MDAPNKTNSVGVPLNVACAVYSSPTCGESLWPRHVFTATGKWCMSVAATLAGCWATCPQRIRWRQRSMIARLVLTVAVVSCVA